ncbi:MAG: glycosyl hydrolase family 28-related protein [Desulfobacula sp.]
MNCIKIMIFVCLFSFFVIEGHAVSGITGDLDHDCDVDGTDLELFSANYGAALSSTECAGNLDLWINVRNYGAVGDGIVDDTAAISDAIAAADGKAVFFSPGRYKISSGVVIPPNVTLKMEPGAILLKSQTGQLSINGPFIAPLSKVFEGWDSGLTFESNAIEGVFPQWFGALANGANDDTTALMSAIKACGNNKTLLLTSGTYNFTSSADGFGFIAACPIKGVSPNLSILKNIGTGSALLINGAKYYTRWNNFSVVGNESSQDGIVTSNNGGWGHETSYSSFHSVDSKGHGRHGIVHRMAWATKYFDCKFYNNNGLGIYINSETSDMGYGPVQFVNCESRWNGGTGNASADFLKGGVRVAAATLFDWIGGIVESNNAWGFIISAQTANSVNNSSINGVHMEDTPRSDGASDVGGLIRASGNWDNLSVTNSWLSYGATNGATGYGFYLSADNRNGLFSENGNFIGPGTPDGTEILKYTHGNVLEKSSNPYFQTIVGGAGWTGIAKFGSINSSVFVDMQAPGNGNDNMTLGFLNADSVRRGKIGYNLSAETMTFRTSGTDAMNLNDKGDLKLLLNGKGLILTNQAGTVTRRVRLNNTGDGFIFEPE